MRSRSWVGMNQHVSQHHVSPPLLSLPPVSGAAVRKLVGRLRRRRRLQSAKRLAVVLPVEDGGGGDAVWGWSRALDSHKRRNWVDVKQGGKNERRSVSRPRGLDSGGGLARGAPCFCGRIPDFWSGIRGLCIDSSALWTGWATQVDKKCRIRR